MEGIISKIQLEKQKGARPPNGGQVLAEFAKTLVVNVHQFNPEQRLSGRDYTQRVRRVSIPTPRPTKHLQSAIQKKLKQKNSTLVKRLPQNLSKEIKQHQIEN